MIFKTAFENKKEKKLLVKVGLDDGKEVWGLLVDSEKFNTTAQQVYNYASKAFKDGDEVDVIYTKENGQYLVERISKKGAKTTTKKIETESTGFKCSDCGKELKDGKYKKCYTCNKKNPTKTKKNVSSSTKSYYEKSPEVQESIKRQAIGHMTSRTLIALQGRVDPNNVEDVATKIYQLYQELVG